MTTVAVSRRREPALGSNRPRVLYVTLAVPFPPTSGGRRRDAELIRRLASRAEIHLAAITSSYDREVAAAADALEFCMSVAVVPQSEERPEGCPPGVRAFASAELMEHLRTEHRQRPYDLIHVEGYYLASVAAALPGVPLALTAENIEADIDRQLARIGAQRAESDRTRRYEIDTWRRATSVAALTVDDADRMRQLAPGVRPVVCPNGIDQFTPKPPSSFGRDRAVVGFFGNYSYPPTEDTAHYLYTGVWPEVSRAVPAARILFCGAGRRTPRVAHLVAGDRRATFGGAVAEVSEFFDAVDVLVAPIRAGGGVKVKILEAISHGTPIVTTPIGALGLADAVAAGGIVVAADRSALVDATVALLRSPERRQRASDALAKASATLPTWDEASAAVWRLWRATIARGS